MSLLRKIKRHNGCGGFINFDLKNSMDCMSYGCCSKCKAEKLTDKDMYISEEPITLFGIYNKHDDLCLRVNNTALEFETESDAENFCKENNITDYIIKPNIVC